MIEIIDTKMGGVIKMTRRERAKNLAESNIKEIVKFVEFHYGKPFPRFKKQLLRMVYEYYKTPERFFLSNGSLLEMLKEKCQSDKYEFIYFPEMAMTITNIAWHSDLIREFLFDLDHPKLRGVDFNDMAYQGIQRGIVGFVSSVSNNMQVNIKMLNNQDREYLSHFLRGE